MRHDNHNPYVVFITSSSRSGSTMLDMMLGENKDYVSVGEMRQLQGFAAQDHELCEIWDKEYPLVCTCGKAIERCEFWGKVQAESGLQFRWSPFKSQASAAWRRLVQIIYLLLGGEAVKKVSLLLPPVRRELEAAYNCFCVYSAISRLTGAQYIVDSSKIPYQYMLLRIANPERTKLIMLYRDGRAVTNSMVRANRHREWQGSDSPFAEAARSWVRLNRKIRLFTSRTPAKDKIAVRYEDICDDPNGTLQTISSSLGVRMPENVVAISKTGRHNIGGSPSRFDLSRLDISVDTSWKTSLSSEKLEEFERIGGKLNRKLGYV